jgi:hypothetical protein
VFREAFEEIVRRCLQAGLVEGKKRVVDGTMIEANASPQSRVARGKLKDVVRASRTVREYLCKLEKANPVSDAKMAFQAKTCSLGGRVPKMSAGSFRTTLGGALMPSASRRAANFR